MAGKWFFGSRSGGVHVKCRADNREMMRSVRCVFFFAAIFYFSRFSSIDAAPLLTNVQQVLDLGVEGARRSTQFVHVQGVVTYVAANRNWLFVQDGTAGLLVVFTNHLAEPLFGQDVEISGVAGAGQFTTECVNAQVRVMAPGSLPVARRTPAEKLGAGEDCGRWVELEGRVRDISVQATEMTLLISSERWQFHTYIVLTNTMSLPLDWLDTKVRLRGVCWTQTDRENNPTSFRLYCSSTNQMVFMEPGREDVFAAPLVSPSELRRRTTNSDSRIRVVGTVLMHSPGRRLYIQDEVGPVRTRLFVPFLRASTAITYVDRPHLVPLEPGDRVEVIAAPALTDYTPLLVEAEYRKIGTGPPPKPLRRSIQQLTSGQHSGELVTLNARLIDHLGKRDGANIEQELTLETEGTLFQAVLSTSRSNTIAELQPNSMVELTGICSAGSGEWERLRRFRLLLRTPHDVRDLGPAPFWTSWPVGRILTGMAILGVAALGWIWLLRRRVAQRTAAVAASEAHTRMIIDTALDAVVTMDVEGKVCGWSAQAEKIFGWQRQEATGRTVAELIIPERYREAHSRGLKHLLATGQGSVVNRRIEISALRKHGQEFPVELSIVAMKSNGAWNFSAFARDLSERKQAEAAIAVSEIRLRESEEKFRRAFRATPALISVVRLRDHCYVEVNETFLEVSGYAKEEIIGRTALQLGFWPEPAQRAEFVQLLERDGSVHEFECTCRMKSGRVLRLLISAERIEIQGEPCILGMSLDVTERKRAEQELHNALAREKELGELKSSFVSMVSHEFRTPLEVIICSSDILDRYLDRLTPEQRQEHLQAIHHSVKRMSGMMEDVLLLGKVEAGKLDFKPMELNLPSLCRRVVDEILSATNHQNPIALEVDGEIARARGDEGLLRHIFTNLLSNAVKYSRPRGGVKFEARREKDQAVFRIRDEGLGIPSVDQERMFQSFHRGRNATHLPGTGLGLVIVKRCVELHGGSIRCESTEEVGTTFTVTLPMFGTGL
jgi:PAS domain S-box-containing protein